MRYGNPPEPTTPDHGIDAENPLIIDLDATLLDAHSEKENATRPGKRTWFHPLCAFIDHGPDGTGEPAAILLRPGIPAPTPPPTTKPFSPKHSPSCRGSHRGALAVKCWCAPTPVAAATNSWTTATKGGAVLTRVRPHRHPRRSSRQGTEEGADPGLRRRRARARGRLVRRDHRSGRSFRLARRDATIVRKERPHPGAQLRFTDVDGLRLTAFVTNTRRGQPPDRNCATAAAPAARTASAPARTP
ncbi:hypothetical protein F5X71_27135 [Nocardia brasiliensis]|uniref:Transposase DDE domain-containing protein n=1 Tax=Nocardia brasiliensis TaxID=37326 RepID=A0A6G9Y3C1_NOCBR|nr:hypothetical protein F5X71_27135 [Nocardia brasiliensis]